MNITETEAYRKYAENAPKCAVCKIKLEPAPARWDGKPTFVGYCLCPKHQNAGVIFKNQHMQRTQKDAPN